MRKRIAIIAGPTATVLNNAPLVTSNKAREKYGLPVRKHFDGSMRVDELRPQRLAAPAKVYIEQFSAHPLERDAAELYGPPDGYISDDGSFYAERRSASDTPVFEAILQPDDGLYLLPYMARQADGSAWEFDGTSEDAPPEKCRQPFAPDASRLLEEIARFDLDDNGYGDQLASQAEFEFYRVVPSGGYKAGLLEAERTDIGTGDVEPEELGKDFFPYRPWRYEPPRSLLSHLTNKVQRVANRTDVAGVVWLEGSPFVEETSYWLNLLIDTTRPIVCVAGDIGHPGRKNVRRAVEYIVSGVWEARDGCDDIGAVGIVDDQAITSREFEKLDARPGGFVAGGGHGGVVASFGNPGKLKLRFRPVAKHTHGSEVNVRAIPTNVAGVTLDEHGSLSKIDVRVKDNDGQLLVGSIPSVRIIKHARYLKDGVAISPSNEVEIIARIAENLKSVPLAGFVAEGSTPYGQMSEAADMALRGAIFSGMPVVKTGRGSPEGSVSSSHLDLFIAGDNLSATKARLLLMACLMRYGSLPLATDPDDPTAEDLMRTKMKIAEYQNVFDLH